jgi:hypothetical protein
LSGAHALQRAIRSLYVIEFQPLSSHLFASSVAARAAPYRALSFV